MKTVSKKKSETVNLGDFINLIRNLKESAESARIPYGEQADNEFMNGFNEFHVSDREVVVETLSKVLGKNIHSALIKKEVDLLFSKDLEFIDFLAMIVIIASKEKRVSRYSIIKAVEDIIQGNY